MAIDKTIQSLAPGTVLQDRYMLFEPLGQGKMGEVWRAWDYESGLEVAVKMLPKAESLQKNELETAMRLNHPNLVKAYGHFEDVVGNDIRTFLVTENAGWDMFRIMYGKDGIGGLVAPLEPRLVMVLTKEYLEALNALHSQGIAHLDVKPRNSLIHPDGIGKLSDYGVAKNVHAPTEEMFFGGSTVGTAMYAGEEQFYSLNAPGNPTAASTRCDIYAVSAQAIEYLTKKKFAERWLPKSGTQTQEEKEDCIKEGLKQPVDKLEKEIWDELVKIHGKGGGNADFFNILISGVKSARVTDRQKERVWSVDYTTGGDEVRRRMTPVARRMSTSEARKVGAYTDIKQPLTRLQDLMFKINPEFGNIEREEGDVSYSRRLEANDLLRVLYMGGYRVTPIESFRHLFAA